MIVFEVSLASTCPGGKDDQAVTIKQWWKDIGLSVQGLLAGNWQTDHAQVPRPSKEHFWFPNKLTIWWSWPASLCMSLCPWGIIFMVLEWVGLDWLQWLVLCLNFKTKNGCTPRIGKKQFAFLHFKMDAVVLLLPHKKNGKNARQH